MQTLAIALGAGVLYLVAYHTYGKYLARRIFKLDPQAPVPSVALNDDNDYVPTSRGVVFGHHFTSIAGTGPIVGPAIAVMWGWLPALIWVLLGSILIGAVHDMGALIVSMRNRGQTVGDIAGRLLNKRVRLLFLFILFMALTIVLAIFGLVIAAVFKQYPSSIFPCTVQIPIAITIGVWLHRKGVNLLAPSLLALAVMYLSVIYGDWGPLHTINTAMAAWPVIVWVILLLIYSYIASVLPVWSLLQPRDYINSLQLITALGLIVAGLCAAAIFGGAPPVEGAARPELAMAAPMIRHDPPGAPMLIPFLFITVACGACSGFHCLVSSGTSSKQLKNETDATFVGYGSMLTEGFLATVVILACVAGLGLGIPIPETGRVLVAGVPHTATATAEHTFTVTKTDSAGSPTITIGEDPADEASFADQGLLFGAWETAEIALVGTAAYDTRYASWSAAGGLAKTVAAFVDGSANFLKAMGIPAAVAVALMGVLVASFAGTTMDTACRLQRYVVQELASTFAPGALHHDRRHLPAEAAEHEHLTVHSKPSALNPLVWLTNKHGATIFAILLAGAVAAMPAPGATMSWANSGKGGLILWPLFGATNQLLAGLAFLVIAFYLWRRRVPVWMIAIPMLFMLIMPAWAMIGELPRWIHPEPLADGTPVATNWVVVVIAIATVALEAWMIVEAILLWPRAKGVLEQELPPLPRSAAAAE